MKTLNKFKQIVRVLADKDKMFLFLSWHGFYHWVNDEKYIKRLYKAKTGLELNLDNPVSFNEKIQWLKLFDRKEEYTKLVDKYDVKKYVSRKIGSNHIIPTIGIYDRYEEIDFESLPEQFVIKCTHDSGSATLVKDKKAIDCNVLKKRFKKLLKKNYYYYGREWAYKNVKPRIIIEQLITNMGEPLNDYKVFCFNGQPKMIQIDYDRFRQHKRNLYTNEWEYIDAEIEYPSEAGIITDKPDFLDEMIRYASKLSKGLPHVRVDFYYANGNIYFGEMTLYHGDGFETFKPLEFGDEIGGWLELPHKKEGMIK